ncbi:hypothetical protein ABK040_005051 [Willaertia magna]
MNFIQNLTSHSITEKITSVPFLATLSCLSFGYYWLRRYAQGSVVSKDLINQSDLSGKIIIVTGVAPNGIGYETARKLYELNGTVVLAVRNTKSGEDTKKLIEKDTKIKTNGKIEVMYLDLNDLKVVKEFVSKFIETFSTCHILINNAGVCCAPHSTTEQGIEKHFGVNCLGHFLLTMLLLPKLKEHSDSRILNLSSFTINNISKNDLNITKESVTGMCSDVSKFNLYLRSKFAIAALSKRFDRSLQEEKLDSATSQENRPKCVFLCPGMVTTNIHRDMNVLYLILLSPIRLFCKVPYYGSQTSIYCALVTSLKGGHYYSECRDADDKVNPLVKEKEVQDNLWNICMKLCEDYL